MHETFPDFRMELAEPRDPSLINAVFPGLESVIAPDADGDGPPLKVCILTPDIFGPIRNGGIGTAYRYLADFLVSCGHDVTVLYGLGTRCENGSIEDWIEHYAQRGITFVPMPEPAVPANPRTQMGALARRSYSAYEWLKGQDFDLVHVSEWTGLGYFPLLAKHLGLHFADTRFAVKCSSPLVWNREGGLALIDSPEELATAYLERRSVELADYVISGSRHLLRWMAEHGYRLPEGRTFSQPNVMLQSTVTAGRTDTATPIDELVFFGRLEPRKGVHVFTNAVSRLARTGSRVRKITFLGKKARSFDIDALLKAETPDWPFDVQVIDDASQADAISYLCGPGRLAVMPSILENSSFAIYECLEYGVPFLASDTGGNPELVDPSFHDRVLFAPKPEPLFQSISRALAAPPLVATCAFDNAENLATWRRWHRHQAIEAAARRRQAGHATNVVGQQAAGANRPLVSVCIAHFERPGMLEGCLASVEAQTWDATEIIVVDDGSTSEEALAALERVSARTGRFPVTVIRQPNQYLGASRNTAARAAKGRYILFMDDDNLAKPDEVATLARIMERTGHDILTCFSDAFTDLDEDGAPRTLYRIIPVGPSLSLGLFRNGFGDSNMMVRRSSFEALGGFTEEYRIGRDDQEFLSRACLAGYRVDVVPEALYDYRLNQGSGMKAMNFSRTSGQLRVARNYFRAAPQALQNAMMFALSLFNQRDDLARENRDLKVQMRHGRRSEPAALGLEAALGAGDLALRAMRRELALRDLPPLDVIDRVMQARKGPSVVGGLFVSDPDTGTETTRGRLRGWVWNASAPRRSCHVVLTRNGAYLATLAAGRSWDGLGAAIPDRAGHGFEVSPDQLDIADGDVIAAFALESGRELANSPAVWRDGRLRAASAEDATPASVAVPQAAEASRQPVEPAGGHIVPLVLAGGRLFGEVMAPFHQAYGSIELWAGQVRIGSAQLTERADGWRIDRPSRGSRSFLFDSTTPEAQLHGHLPLELRSPDRVVRAPVTLPRLTPVDCQNLAGAIDGFNPQTGSVRGWLLDRIDAGHVLRVSLFWDGRHVLDVAADQEQPFRAAHGGAIGPLMALRSFSVTLPRDLMDGASHRLEAWATGSNFRLLNTPRQVETADMRTAAE
jgi:O-antigen biosynthesis protein